jgi:hypothetical protein
MAQQRLNSNSIARACISTLEYYSFFKYPLSPEEIHTFLPIMASLTQVQAALKTLHRGGALHYDPKSGLYALRGHGTFIQRRVRREPITERKIAIAESYSRTLRHIPCIYMLALSGSCAMHNASKQDDIDITIVTAPGCIWIGRFIAVLVAKVLGLHRYKGMKNPKDMLCLNLFFDAADTRIPKEKRNAYVAHEVVQMKPLYIRGRVYKEFLDANRWVYLYLPNASSRTRGSLLASHHYTPYGILLPFRILNWLARTVQLSIMHPRTHERITETQLWFFPDDFERKLPGKLLKRAT